MFLAKRIVFAKGTFFGIYGELFKLIQIKQESFFFISGSPTFNLHEKCLQIIK